MNFRVTPSCCPSPSLSDVCALAVPFWVLFSLVSVFCAPVLFVTKAANTIVFESSLDFRVLYFASQFEEPDAAARSGRRHASGAKRQGHSSNVKAGDVDKRLRGNVKPRCVKQNVQPMPRPKRRASDSHPPCLCLCVNQPRHPSGPHC